MNYQNPTQSFLRPTVKIGMQPRSRRKPGFSIALDSDLLRAVAKVGMMVLPVVVITHLFLASVVTDLGESIAVVKEVHNGLADKNIELLVQKARITTPDNVQLLAGEKLSLVSPEKGQIRKFNRRPGTFTYL